MARQRAAQSPRARNPLTTPRRRESEQIILLRATAVALVPVWAIAAGSAREKIFEINVTNDLTITSGEPQIAVNPTSPRNLAIVEFGTGSVKRPAYDFNPVILADLLQDVEGAMANTGRVMLSKDGGNHWTQSGPPSMPSFFRAAM